RLYRAEVLVSLRKFTDAMKDCDEALNVDDKSAMAYHYRGVLHALSPKRDLNKALQDLNKAVDLEPKNPAHYLKRGAIHQARGDLNSAQRDAISAKELSGSSQ